MHVRSPVWLRSVARPGAFVFGGLFALESLARALLATVITLQALTLLEDARDVSIVFALVGVTGFLANFAIPALVRRISRRMVYTLGAAALILAAVLLGTVTISGQVSGMLVRVFGAACLSITTSLYIMQYIAKRDLTRSEPLRLQLAAFAWTIGPWLGVKMYVDLGPAYAYGASAAASLVLLAYFWYLRLSDNPVIQKATKPPPSPIKSIGRFVSQPRLRLAWVIVFGRSSWWVFFFVYTPVYMVQAGYAKESAALVISAGNGLLFLSPIFGRLAARFGVRQVMTGAFLAAGAGTLLAGVFYANAAVTIGCLLVGALACVALDALGNIPFMRAVHTHERPQMTTVFRTYLDASELLPPAVFAVILTFADLRAVFLVFGVVLLGFTLWPRYLPKSM
jgi:MFS family permease